MRFPSLDALALRGRQVLARFPYTLATGALTAVLAIIATSSAVRANDDAWGFGAMVAALGLPTTTAIALLAEVRGWPAVRTAAAMLGAALALFGFYLVWPGMDEKHNGIRYFQLSAALHLIVAFLPFVGRRESLAFWQYNRRLFLSFLRAVVFSGVLFVGLAIALAALDKLFGLDVEGETYLRLWFVIAFVVNTWIFLAGVPDDLEALADDPEYPKALKIFTQYILTPLVAVYLLILLAYLVKILVTGQWPSGWIGYLVTSVSVAGILGFLLVHPLRDDPAEGWIRAYRRWLFIGLIPAACMLLVAFTKRIGPYGLTELRYLGVVLGGWLLAIAVLFTLRREHGIRIIPLSLSILLLITLFGPLGATTRSIASQAARLEREIIAARATQSPGTVSPAEREASGALRFLVTRDANAGIAQAFGGTMPGNVVLPDTIRWRADSLAGAIMRAAALDYTEAGFGTAEGHFSYNATSDGALAIHGYQWLLPIHGGDTLVAAGPDTFRVALDSAALRLTLTTPGGRTISFDMASLLDSLETTPTPSRRGTGASRLRLGSEQGEMAGALLLAWISGRREEGRRRIDAWHGQLLVGP